MSHETPARPSGTSDRAGCSDGSSGECSPLQTRAPFLKNWSWESIISINQRACARIGAQHGVNPQTGETFSLQWEASRVRSLTLLETMDFLRACHKGAPFLLFNGNTFSFLGRELTLALFSDLPPIRKRELASAVAHYIAGVLDRESMVGMVESLCVTANLARGDRVKTLRGSLRGEILEILADGRVLWRAETGSVFVSLPESLQKTE